MIQEAYVSFEVAKLLKERGFHEKVNHVYHYYTSAPFYQRHLRDFNGEDYKNLKHEHYSAPTLQMAMKWLREVHNIDVFPWKIGKGIYSCAIFNSDTGQDLSSDKDFPSEKYEEACEAALKYTIENLI